MVQSIQGIVLDAFKFKETAIICRLYTVEHGLLSVLVNGVRSKGAKVSQVYLQPLSHIECSLFFKEKAGLMRIANLGLVQSPLGTLPNMRKYAQAIFIAEIVLRTSKERQVDERLFYLLSYIIHCLQGESNLQDLHLFFLTSYSNLLGFALEAADRQTVHGYREEISLHLDKLVQMKEYHTLGINKSERAGLIRWILAYYQQHFEFSKIKSLDILEEVFS